MTADAKRQRAGSEAVAAASKGKGKAPAANGKNAAAAATEKAAAARNADVDKEPDRDDASSSDITSSSSSAYSSSSDDDDDEVDSTDESSEEEEEDGKKKKKKKKNEEINVDFEFYDPKPIDFLGLKMLLGTWLDGLEFDSSGLCDALIAQNTVGTVLKTEKAGDPIGVLSCLDARRGSSVKQEKEEEGGERKAAEEKRHIPALAQLQRYLVSCAPTPADAEKVKEAFAAGSGGGKEKHTGVVVSERLLNVPPAVAQPLLEALFSEIEWATEDEPTEELKKSFEFGQYLVFSRVYLDDGKGGGEEEEEEDEEDDDDDEEDEKRRKAKKARAAGPSSCAAAAAAAPSSSTPSSPVVVFARPEDQFFSEAARWSFVFEPPPLPEASDRHRQPQRRGELRRARLVALVDASRVSEVRAKLKEAVGSAV